MSSTREPHVLDATFCAAIAEVVQQVDALAQQFFRSREAFHERLAVVEDVNNAQTQLYPLDVGGVPFHTCTEVMQRQDGILSTMASSVFTVDINKDGYVFCDQDSDVVSAGAALYADRLCAVAGGC